MTKGLAKEDDVKCQNPREGEAKRGKGKMHRKLHFCPILSSHSTVQCGRENHDNKHEFRDFNRRNLRGTHDVTRKFSRPVLGLVRYSIAAK